MAEGMACRGPRNGRLKMAPLGTFDFLNEIAIFYLYTDIPAYPILIKPQITYNCFFYLSLHCVCAMTSISYSRNMSQRRTTSH